MKTELIHQLIFEQAEKSPYRTAFWLRHSDGFESLNYKDLTSFIINVAAGMVDLGIKPGMAVGICAPNSIEWCIAYLATLAAGAIVVPLDSQLKYIEVRGAIERSEMRLLFCTPDSFQDLQELKAMVPPHPEIIALTSAQGGYLSIGHLEKVGRSKKFISLETDPDKMALLLFTSGTSGESKGVMLSHRNIVSNIKAVAIRLSITSEDRFLSVLPLHHTFEATAGFLYPLSIGASIAQVKSLKSSDIINDLRELQITLMCAVPLLYEKMYLGMQRALSKKSAISRLYVSGGQALSKYSRKIFKLGLGKKIFKPLRTKAGLESVRMFVSGGAAVRPEISEFFCNLGIDLLQGYGLTETSPVVSVNPIKNNRYNSSGTPLAGVEIKIINTNESGIGEIAVKGENIMLGYYHNPDATSEVMQDGYFLTGDLGYLDKDQYLYITGRKKNVIVSAAGKNIYPEELEAAIDSSPYILESAVIPRKKGSGEEPIAVVVPDYEMLSENGETTDDKQLKKKLTSEVSKVCDHFAEYKRIKDVIVFTTELPKTSTRKVKKYILIDSLQKLGEIPE